jgi:aminodeoxychorismate synthase component I
VDRVKTHITRGDIYQANLSQRFAAAYVGDPFEFYASLIRRTPAPHSAFVATPSTTLASFSPETFLRIRSPGELETRPIKGTRPRGATPAEDRAAARELVDSAKDRAELLMIVDLERNDLSRVCEPGSVEVQMLAGLRTFPTVHHLVASVIGKLRRGTGAGDMLRATFPGGSITGAPKIRAMQILSELEPASRNFFTGSLLWFGDDGTLDSSILIRTAVFGEDRVYLGAGGGIVADSDPEAEWEESNHKARSLTEQLGFEPREAT